MHLVIYGKPFAKQRPRMTRQGHAFTPKATVTFESTVRELAARELATPYVGPVALTVTAVFEPARSWSRKKREAAMGTPHIQRPDMDNVVKAIQDGLNRVAFGDDSQIADLRATKLWGSPERTEVTVEPLDELGLLE